MDYVDVPISNFMFNNFYKLIHLSCSNCPSVTDKVIIKVLDNCKNLSTLDLRKTGITYKTPIYASKRKFVFKKLTIIINPIVKDSFYTRSTVLFPYLRIVS